MTHVRKTELADPASALASYLDDLLQTATDSARQTEVQTQVTPPEPPAEALARSVPQPIATPTAKPEPAVRAVVVEPVVSTPEPATEVLSPIADAPSAGRPDWSEKPFECLIFRVAGLQLAVPLILLGAIHRMESKVKSIPGRPGWYMGLLPDRDQNLRVVDTAEWIMAGRVPVGARDGYRFVIRLDNSEWALACDDVAQSFTLDPEDVRWRSARSKRPWLAGTVIKQMCALIDVGTMASLLARAEREHRLTLD